MGPSVLYIYIHKSSRRLQKEHRSPARLYRYKEETRGLASVSRRRTLQLLQARARAREIVTSLIKPRMHLPDYRLTARALRWNRRCDASGGKSQSRAIRVRRREREKKFVFNVVGVVLVPRVPPRVSRRCFPRRRHAAREYSTGIN